MIAVDLPGDRLHLQHGPIDLIIGAEGARSQAFAQAKSGFAGVIEGLMEEITVLRSPKPHPVSGPVARRMMDAVDPYRHRAFVTPMAAVAGAVADHVLAHMLCAGLTKAYVNNGGDIALYLSDGAQFETAIHGTDARELGRISVTSGDAVRGIATSGQGGRSLSRGIAESVTVLAASAAQADVAATLIANAVDNPSAAQVRRVPACDIQPESDLGALEVVTSVGALSHDEVSRALGAGAETAKQMMSAGLFVGAALFLRGQSVTVGEGIRSLADA